MISKELLSEVLDIENRYKCKLASFSIDSKILFFKLDRAFVATKRINIHELAHKCKLHFVKLGYEFDIQKDNIKISKRKDLPYYLTTITNMNQGDNFIPYDPYIDIKACQWILDNA